MLIGFRLAGMYSVQMRSSVYCKLRSVAVNLNLNYIPSHGNSLHLFPFKLSHRWVADLPRIGLDEDVH